MGMDADGRDSWAPGKFVIFKGRGSTPVWEEPPLPLSYPIPSQNMYLSGKLGTILEVSLYSCKIFVDGIIGWVDKVNMYTL